MMRFVWVLTTAIVCLAFDIADPIFQGFGVENLVGTTKFDTHEYLSPLVHHKYNTTITVQDSRVSKPVGKEKPVGEYECPSDSYFCVRQVASNDDGESVVTLFAYSTEPPEIEYEGDDEFSLFYMSYSNQLAGGNELSFEIYGSCSPQESISFDMSQLSYWQIPNRKNLRFGNRFGFTRSMTSRVHPESYEGIHRVKAVHVDWDSKSFCREGKWVDHDSAGWGTYTLLGIAYALFGHIIVFSTKRIQRVGAEKFTQEAFAYLSSLTLMVWDKSLNFFLYAMKTVKASRASKNVNFNRRRGYDSILG